MAITFPYTSPSVMYGNQTYTYTWIPPSEPRYYNYTQVTSTGYSTINSQTDNGDGTATLNITVYNNANFIRSGTATGTIAINSACTVRLYNPTLASYIPVYTASLAGSGLDSATTPITHSYTGNVIIPATWYAAANLTWRFDTVDICSSTSLGTFSYTFTKTEATFLMGALLRAVVVRYNDALYTAKNIWIRYNDVLYPMKDLKINVDGVLK